MAAPTRRKASKSRLGALDLLRLCAALGVVAFHFTANVSYGWGGDLHSPAAMDGVRPFTAYGTLGVPLFFVISGFVLLMSAWGNTLPNFVASRVGRLYPAYWVAVVFGIVLLRFAWPEQGIAQVITVRESLLNLSMFQGAFGAHDIDGVFWTLWTELRFYLLVGLLMLVGITRQRIIAFAALWPIVGAAVTTTHSTLLSFFLIPDYAAFFAGGMLIYLLYRDGHDFGIWLLLGLQAVVGLYQIAPAYMDALTGGANTPTSVFRIGVCVLACFGLVALATLTRARYWSAKWMTLAGALTYPVYLMHDNLGGFLIFRTHNRLGPWGAVLLAVGAVLLAGYLIQRFVEAPFGPKLRAMTRRMMERGEEVQTDGPSVPILVPAPAAAFVPAFVPNHASSSDTAELPAWAPEPRNHRKASDAFARMSSVTRADVVTGGAPVDGRTLITAQTPFE